MRTPISRRGFLRQLALGSAALPLLKGINYAASRANLKQTGISRNIVVLGAGLAGLSAAYELQNAGHHITLIEARKPVGGRVRTIRAPFENGQYAEAGPLSFPPSHTFTYGYATDFKLPLRPSFKAGLGQIASIQGSQFKINPDGTASIPLNLKPAERQAGFYGLIPYYLGQYIANVGNPRKGNWPSANIGQLDLVSCQDLLASLGASDSALDIMQSLGLGLLGFGMSSLSALDAVFTEAITADSPFYEIIGGNDQLPAAFKQRLNGVYNKKSQVLRIDQNENSVTVTFNKKGVVSTVTADYAVCALPFSVMNDIEVNPPFSDLKQQAINEIKMTPVTRTYLQFSARSWEQSGYDGEGYTDLQIQDTYSPTLTQGGNSGILASYAAGQNGLNLGQMTESDRERFVLGKLNGLFGGLKGSFLVGTSMIWHEDPFTRGAFVYFQPGQMTTLLPAAQQPEGLIHFAGEHTSAWHGWMNGALESGNRVAAEINALATQESIRVRSAG